MSDAKRVGSDSNWTVIALRSDVGWGVLKLDRACEPSQSRIATKREHRRRGGASARRGLGPPVSRPVRLQLLFEIEHLLENDRVLVGTSVQ